MTKVAGAETGRRPAVLLNAEWTRYALSRRVPGDGAGPADESAIAKMTMELGNLEYAIAQLIDEKLERLDPATRATLVQTRDALERAVSSSRDILRQMQDAASSAPMATIIRQ